MKVKDHHHFINVCRNFNDLNIDVPFAETYYKPKEVLIKKAMGHISIYLGVEKSIKTDEF